MLGEWMKRRRRTTFFFFFLLTLGLAGDDFTDLLGLCEVLGRDTLLVFDGEVGASLQKRLGVALVFSLGSASPSKKSQSRSQ